MPSVKNIEKFCNLIKNSNITRSNYELFAEDYYLVNNDVPEPFKQNFTLKPGGEEHNFTNFANLTYVEMLCNKFDNKISQFDNKISFNLVRYNLIKYVYPFLIIFGFFGNSISIYVMAKKYKSAKKTKNKHHNFSFCLAMLCGADLAILIFGCLREYLEEILHLAIRTQSIYSCKFFFFACYLFSAFSVYLYTFIAFERWYAVTNPILYKQKTGKKNQKRIILIFVFCSLISWPFLLGSTLQESIVPKKSQSDVIDFEVKCELSQAFYLKLTFLDFIFYNCVPFLFAFLFSGLTLIKLIKFRSADQNISLNKNDQTNANYDDLMKSYESRNNCLKNESVVNYSNKNEIRIKNRSGENRNMRSKLDSTYFPSEMDINGNLMNSLYEYDSRKGSSCSRRSNILQMDRAPLNSRQSSKFKMTLMLMAFPISYIITTSPVFFFITLQLFDTYFRLESSTNYETEFAFSRFLMYLNNSLNVLFFILFGKNLRSDFFNILLFKKLRQHFHNKKQNDSQYV